MYKRVSQAKLFDMNKTCLGKGKLLSIYNDIIIIKGKNLPKLSSGLNIFIKVYDEVDGVFTYLCKISVATDKQTTAEIISRYPVYERRASLKVKTDLSFNIKSIIRNGKDITDEVPNIKIYILNLSVGGMLISSGFDFLLNDVITFHFTDLSLESILLEAKIIRIDEPKEEEPDDGVLAYGCRFLKMTGKDEAFILKYLFNRQLQLYRDK